MATTDVAAGPEVGGEAAADDGLSGAQSWSVAEAKAGLSELLQQVESGGPQVITRRGLRVAVVLSAEEWHRKTARSGTLAEFFAQSPLAGSGLEVTRDPDPPREVTV